MALIVKGIADILIEARDSLQDLQKTRWTDQELYRYVDQGMRNIALTTKYNKIIEEIHVADPLIIGLTDTFELSHEAIEFHKITSDQPYELIDSRTIRFPDNKDEIVTIEYYAFHPRVIYGVDTELSLDEDLYDALKFFILYRSYQKEASTENIQKAQYFKSEYLDMLSLHLTRWHGKLETTSRTDFF